MSSSTQLLSTPTMPTPPALPRRASALNTRLHVRPEEPPIPPRLIGSPLLEKLMTSPTAPPRSAHDMWIDGDEFSVRKNGHAVLGSAPTQPQGAARYAAYPPPVPASLQPAGAAAHGSPSAKSSRPIAT